MALAGYQIEKDKIEEKIKEIRAKIGKGSGKALNVNGESGPGVEDAPKRRKFSKAARRRMAAAQKKRWAESRKQKTA